MKMDERNKVKIIDQDHFGNGVAKLQDKVIFVQKALPFEEVEIKIENEKNNFCEASIVKVLSSSSMRVKVDCPYYESCGGCMLLHQKYLEQLLFKQKKVRDVIQKFSKIKELIINPIVSSNPFSYRNKVTLHIEEGKIGYYQEKTHQLIEIEQCLLLYPVLNHYIQSIKENLSLRSVKKGTIFLRVSMKTGKVMIALTGSFRRGEILAKINLKDVASLYLNNELIYGDPYLLEELHHYFFLVSKEAFFQVNGFLTEKLYEKVLSYLKEEKIKTLLDLYCGTGTLSVLASSYCEEVIGIELVKEAVLDASRNCELNQVQNVSFLLGKVEEKLPKIVKTIDAVIVDPPRSGLKKTVIDTLLNLNPRKIIYVSCDPVTLGRDLFSFKEKYEIIEITPFDMFPNTYHVECVCVLNRRPL